MCFGAITAINGSTLTLTTESDPKKPRFKIGDVVYDTINRDFGVLLRRYNIFDDDPWYEEYEGRMPIMVWDLYWTGPNLYGGSFERIQTYTEEGLDILFDSGVIVHYHGS